MKYDISIEISNHDEIPFYKTKFNFVVKSKLNRKELMNQIISLLDDLEVEKK